MGRGSACPAQACPPDVPEPPSTANDCHRQQPVNLKLTAGLNPRATQENTLVMRRSACQFPRTPRVTTRVAVWGAVHRRAAPSKADRSRTLVQLEPIQTAAIRAANAGKVGRSRSRAGGSSRNLWWDGRTAMDVKAVAPAPTPGPGTRLAAMTPPGCSGIVGPEPRHCHIRRIA
jgi:hypothetical protein